MNRAKSKLVDILRKSEKYTKTDMVYLSKGLSWLTFGQGGVAFSSLLLSIVFANFLSKDAYGLYKYILSIGGVIGAFSLTGISTALFRASAKGEIGFLREGLFKALKWSLPAFLISIGFAIYHLQLGNTALATGILIAGSLSPILDAFSLYEPFLNGTKRFGEASLFRVTKSLLSAVGLILIVFLTKNPLTLVVGYFIFNLIISSSFLYSTIKKYSSEEPGNKEASRYSFHTSIMNLVAIIGNKLDSILIFHFFGPAELAVYAFSTAIPDQLTGLLKNIKTLALPKFITQDKEELKKSLNGKSVRFVLFVVPIFIIYVLLAPFIFSVFFPAYISSIVYSQVFAITILLGAGSFAGTYIDAQLAIKEKYAMSVTANILRTTLMVLLIGTYGIWGAIFARLSTKAILGFVGYIVIKRI